MSAPDRGADAHETTVRPIASAIQVVPTEPLTDSSPEGDDELELHHGGARLGHYALLHKLGEGGMGVVYAAYDERLDRRVAIKLLRTTRPKAKLRLIREAQALARLSHPNVVHIYEIAELEGRAFLVMEMIEGITLRQWLRGGTRSRAEILAVFLAAGRGLAAAHAKGLVHRDFKPENVMIRGDGEVVVMDFGLARGEDRHSTAASDELEPGTERVEATESGAGSESEPARELERGLTIAGTIMGTPGYMAPEQLSGEPVSDRADQFSFCVSLWEALYRKRPFRGTHVEAFARALLSGEIEAPDRPGDVPAWMRTVLERGLARHPADRWGSMDELLEALRRDPSRRRRRIGVVGGALGIAAALALAAVMTDERERLERREQLAQCEREGQAIEADWSPESGDRIATILASAEAEVGSTVWVHTRPWLDRYVADWSSVRTQACVEAEVDETRSASSKLAVVDCLDEGRAALQGAIEVLASGEAKLLMSATTTVARLPPPKRCLDESELAHRQPLPEAKRSQIIALRIRLERVRAFEQAGEYARAIAEAEELRGEAEALAWSPLVTDAELVIASAQVGLGKPDEAEHSARRALQAAIASRDELGTLAAATTLTFVVGTSLSRVDEGLAWGQLGEQLITQLDLAGSYHEAFLLNRIGTVLGEGGSYEQSLDYQQRALALTEALFGPEHPNTGRVLLSLANGLSRMGRNEEALATDRRVLRLLEAVHGPSHADVATVHNNTGLRLLLRGDYAGALAELERAREIWEGLSSTQPKVGVVLNNIGFILTMRGDSEQALALHLRALELLEATLGSEHASTALTHVLIGTALIRQAKYDEAREELRIGQETLARTVGPTHPEVYMASAEIAHLLLVKGEPEAALAEYRSALVGWEATLAPDHPYNVIAWLGIGLTLLELGDLEGAREQLERAVAFREKNEVEPELAAARFGLARTLADSDPARARSLAEAAADGYRSIGEFGADELVKVESWLRERP